MSSRGGHHAPSECNRLNQLYLQQLRFTATIRRLLQKSTVSQSCLQDCPYFAESLKRKVLRVRSEGSIRPYVTEAENRKQHCDSPLCYSLH